MTHGKGDRSAFQFPRIVETVQLQAEVRHGSQDGVDCQRRELKCDRSSILRKKWFRVMMQSGW